MRPPFADAAELLLGRSLSPEAAEAAAALLAALGLEGTQTDDPQDLAALLQLAERCTRVFAVESVTAPGLAFFGAEIERARFQPGARGRMGLSGVGSTALVAFRACMGEVAELASQFRQPEDDDRLLPTNQLCPAFAPYVGDGPVPALMGHDLLSGAMVPVPAALVLRPLPDAGVIPPPYPAGLGVAAGPTAEQATLAALCEVIERDATARWWRGGWRGHALPIEQQQQAAAALNHYRQGVTSRRSWLMDISTEFGLPTVVALSCDADGGRIAYGFGTHPTQAASRAIAEMLQIELADQLVARKQAEGGEAALNAIDRMHLRRQGLAGDLPLLWPAPGFGRASDAPTTLPELLERLAASGHRAVAVDLTRPAIGVPVVRVLVTGLQAATRPPFLPRLGTTLTDLPDLW